MRRLYLQFYLTIIASLVLVVLSAGMLWRFGARRCRRRSGVRDGRRTRGRCAARQTRRRRSSRAIDRLHRAAEHRHRAVRARSGDRIASPAGRCRRCRGAKRARLDGGAAAGRPGRSLPDGRWLVGALLPAARRGPAVALLVFLGAIALAVGARRLSARAPAHAAAGAAAGGVEQARRRRSFARASRSRARTRWRGWRRASIAPPRASRNWSARTSCCSPSSHELRTPLSRIRLGRALKDRRRSATQARAGRRYRRAGSS